MPTSRLASAIRSIGLKASDSDNRFRYSNTMVIALRYSRISFFGLWEGGYESSYRGLRLAGLGPGQDHFQSTV